MLSISLALVGLGGEELHGPPHKRCTVEFSKQLEPT